MTLMRKMTRRNGLRVAGEGGGGRGRARYLEGDVKGLLRTYNVALNEVVLMGIICLCCCWYLSIIISCFMCSKC